MTLPIADWWTALAEGNAPTRGEFRVKDTGVHALEGATLLAIDSTGLRHVLIPIRPGAYVEPDERSSGVHIVGRELEDALGTTSFVDVACRKPHLAGVFSHLALEILETLPTNPGRPATVAKRVLHRWRELLERERADILSEAELAGLFGELTLLYRLAERSAAAAEWWAGPTGARFDFQRGSTCVEVKTTMSVSQRIIHVHGVDQLDPPAGLDLYLTVISAERVSGGGTSVPDLVQVIRGLGVDPLEFTTKLAAAHYSDHDEPHYRNLQFATRSEVWFLVNEAFPRVIRSSFAVGDLPAGVGDLRYTLDLTAPPPSPIEASLAVAVVERLAAE